jgi:membrane-associated phospholipid phosphatase
MSLRALAILSLCLPAAAGAQAPRGSIYQVEPLIDAGASLAMLGVGALIDAEKERWAGLSPCGREGRRPTDDELAAFERLAESDGACGRDSIGEFELFVVENESDGARFASDVMLFTMGALPYAFSLIDVFASRVEKPGFRLGEESLVAAEAQAATVLGVNLLKLIVKRPRPLAHNERRSKLERFHGDARLSFPSGHSAFAFASASLVAYGAAARHGNAPVTWVAGSLAYLTAGIVAYLRVEGGKHFITDVLAGAAVGIAAGLIVPVLHRRNDVDPPNDGSNQMMLSIGGTF